MQTTRVSQILEELCEQHDVPVGLVQEMLEEERKIRHLKRRHGVTDRLRIMIEKSLGVEE
jgi:hypothetical protein